jgi:hypothetical protein
MDRITVDVLMVEGVGPEARAHVQNVDERGLPIRVLASRVAEGTGYAVDELPGKSVVALVDGDGELAGFQRA